MAVVQFRWASKYWRIPHPLSAIFHNGKNTFYASLFASPAVQNASNPHTGRSHTGPHTGVSSFFCYNCKLNFDFDDSRSLRQGTVLFLG